MAIKWGLAVIFVAALAWLLWWSGWLTNKQAAFVPGNQNATSTEQTAPLNGMSASNDASDEAISQDTAAIDAQLSAYTADNSKVDSSMNDKQISQ
jgi:hypothetical protein